MTDTRTPRWTRVECEPLAPIELGRRPDRKAFRWGLMLVWFMRLVAVLWVLHSLLNWSAILGVGPDGTNFESLDERGFAATVFFAVVDPVAAVGLWLATPWGGVTWLFAVAAQIFVVLLLPSLFANGPLLSISNGVLVVFYFALTFAASRERE